MPAVQLTRLKSQIDSLAWHFTRPEEFILQLRRLLELYSDYTYRPGEAVSKPHVLQSYHVPPVVLRQIEQALGRLARENPHSALTIADSLWKQLELETKQIAASLLGNVPLSEIEEILRRLVDWGLTEDDRLILTDLFSLGTKELRKTSGDRWGSQITTWLASNSLKEQRIGLLSSLALIQDRSYQNLPPLFKGLIHTLGSHPAELQSELSEVILELGRRSPTETAFTISQALNLAPSSELVRLVRKCLPGLPLPAQNRLKTALQSIPKNSEQ